MLSILTDNQPRTEVMHLHNVDPPKTRAEWAAEISSSYFQGLEAHLRIGNGLLEAKASLNHGQFGDMIENDLPFSSSVAQRYMRIASDLRFSNATLVQHLPDSSSSLDELRKLSDEQFNKAVADGTINPKMTRTDAIAVRKQANKGDEVQHQNAPAPVNLPLKKTKSVPGEVIFAEITDLNDHIELKVDELSDAVSQNEIKVDAKTKKRIANSIKELQSSIDKLQSLIRAKSKH